MSENRNMWIIVAVLIIVLLMSAYALYTILFVPCPCVDYSTGVVTLGT
jgi:hypothetical protein